MGDFGYWIKTDSVHGIEPGPEISMACPRCPDELDLHHTVLHNGYRTDDRVIGYMVKCSGCDYYHQHEVAVPPDYYDTVLERRDGQATILTYDGDYPSPEVKERMAATGYW